MSSFSTALVLVSFTCCLLAQESQGTPSTICSPDKCLAPVDYSHNKVELFHKGVAISHLSGGRCYKSLTATCADPVRFMIKDTDNVKSLSIDCDAQTQRWNIPTCIRIRDKDGLGYPVIHVFVNGRRDYETARSGQSIAVPAGSRVALTCRNRKSKHIDEMRWQNRGDGIEKWGQKYLRLFLDNVRNNETQVYFCQKIIKKLWLSLFNYVFIDVIENLGNPKCKTKPLDRKIRFKTKYGRLTKGLFSTGTVLEFRCKDGHSLSDKDGRVCFEDGWSRGDFPRCRPTPTSLENKEQDTAIAHQKMKPKRVRRARHVGKRSTVYCPKANGCRECKDPWIRNGYISGRTDHPHLEGSMVHIACMEGYTFVDSRNKAGRITCNKFGRWSLTPEDVCVASGCPHPGTIDGGYIHFSSEQVGTTQLYPIGTNVKYSCNDHHSLIGVKSTRTCKRSGNDPIGEWSPHGTPICIWVQKTMSWGW